MQGFITDDLHKGGKSKTHLWLFLVSSRNVSVERRTYKCKFTASLRIITSRNCIEVALHRALLLSPFCLEKYIFIKVCKERRKLRSADIYNVHDLAWCTGKSGVCTERWTQPSCALVKQSKNRCASLKPNYLPEHGIKLCQVLKLQAQSSQIFNAELFLWNTETRGSEALQAPGLKSASLLQLTLVI